MREAVALPSATQLKELAKPKGVGWGVLLANCLAQALITVGVLASLYAGYLNPEFRVTASQLSAVINQELGMNFYDLVNSYRVQEFRALLADPSRREEKLLTLAFDAGFNSKPTFNKVVLKLTGRTPSQLREEEIASRPSR